MFHLQHSGSLLTDNFWWITIFELSPHIGPCKDLLHISDVYGSATRFGHRVWRVSYNGQYILAITKDNDI